MKYLLAALATALASTEITDYNLMIQLANANAIPVKISQEYILCQEKKIYVQPGSSFTIVYSSTTELPAAEFYFDGELAPTGNILAGDYARGILH